MSTVPAVRYPVQAALRAQELAALDWPVAHIRNVIHDEFGSRPTFNTVRRWTNEAFAERRRQQQNMEGRAKRAEAGRFALAGKGGPSGGPSAEYVLAFMAVLRDRKLSYAAIAKVLQVLLDEPRWTRHMVEHALEEGSFPRLLRGRDGARV